VSFLDVYEGRTDPTIFRDKMVFIGTVDATGFADDYQVPTSARAGKMAGVEIHARAFATLLAAQFFAEQPYPMTVALIWLLCLVTGLMVFRLSIVPSALASFALGAAYFLGSLIYAENAWD